MALKKCSGCGIMHRRDRSCHWCGEIRPAAWRSPAVLKSATGIAAVALIAVGSWSVRGQAADVFARAIAEASRPSTELTLRPTAATRSPEVTPQQLLADSTANVPLPVGEPDSLLVASAEGALIGADTIQWVPAVARTWVNVRRDASRIGDVVGVIKPSEKAMLGIGRSGWRQVKAPEVSGWVDPRLFEADSLRIRG
ncbi:MAG: hypothetical protein ABMA00_19970 [Gemmatimonas sp.]